MSARPITVAALCTHGSTDQERNWRRAEELVRDAAKAGAQWVALPEAFHYRGSYDEIHAAAQWEWSPRLQALRDLAKSLGVMLFAGSVYERAEGTKKVYNTAYVFDRGGAPVAKYRKLHLFNLQDPAAGLSYCESDGILEGEGTTAFALDGLRVGLGICYDLRFPEFFAATAGDAPCDVFVLPSAFTRSTGEAHWELLCRARAVEMQSYFVAPNQGGSYAPGKASYGHALVIDPWGNVLADSGPGEGFALATLDPARIADVRRKLPALANKRDDMRWRKK